MLLNRQSKPRFDGLPAGERSLAGQYALGAGIAPSPRDKTTRARALQLIVHS